MRLFFTLLTTFLMLHIHASGQITITQSDMPGQGETYLFSNAANPGVINFQKTGPNQTWDYTNLQAEDQYVDTYQSMNNVPSIYQLLRFQKGANLAKNEQQLPGGSIPVGGPLDNIISFFESDAQSFERVAFGVTLASNDIPIQFDTNDVFYNFPLQYGQKDSNTSFFSFPPSNIPLPIPGDIYFERQQKRVNSVDGWGTLKTPYGEFQTLRVKTQLYYDDSLFAQGQGQDIPMNKEIQYKWLAKGMGPPLLTVTTREIAGTEQVTNVTYRDNCQPITSSVSTKACDLYTSPSGESTWRKSGNYQDTLNNASPIGCDSVFNIDLTIRTVDSSITINADTLTAQAQNATYQWLNCNDNYTPLDGETNKTLKPTASGTYAVEVTKNGCTDTSGCKSVSGVGIKDGSKAQIRIMAYPLNDKVKVDIPHTTKARNYRMLTTTGKIAQSGSLEDKGTHTINVSNISPGIYLIVVQGKDMVKTKKIIVD